jgi:glycosyltransferase involved in cell wall biosynthesis
MTLLCAFAKLRQLMPEATLHLAGGPGFRNERDDYYLELRNFVAKTGLEEAVTFLGNVDEHTLLKEYGNCSALVLSSILETAPMVIMQALAAGKPVVSTDAGGARYLVEDGETGFIVPIGDDKALANALFRLLSDDARLKEMGRRAKQIAEQRFRATIVANRTNAVYYEILRQPLP